MNILVLAANGRTGVQVVKELIRKNHTVSGFVRPNENLNPAIKKISLIYGDATDYGSIVSATKNIDVVISVIGHVKGSAKDVQTKAIHNLAEACKTNKFKIVSLTGTGVRDFADKPSIFDRILNLGLQIVDPKRLNDGIKHYETLKKSDANWTILRVLKLSNSNSIEKYTLTESGPAKNLVSRKTVAKALVEIAETNTWDRKMPVLTKQ